MKKIYGVINYFIYNKLNFFKKIANCGTGVAIEIGRDEEVTTNNQ